MGRADRRLSPAQIRALRKLMSRAGLGCPLRITPEEGGKNNRAFGVDTDRCKIFMKCYFRYSGDRRNRQHAEFAWSRFAWRRGVRWLPEPLATDRRSGFSLFEYVPGRRLDAGEVTAGHVGAALRFFAEINRGRRGAPARRLPAASESCFSVEEHLRCVERRVRRLEGIRPKSAVQRSARRFVKEELVPEWNRVREGARTQTGTAALRRALPFADRVLSPSDFGFHNVIVRPEGELCFIDFEYAGWDDPAKMICDLFLQPAVQVPVRHRTRVLDAAAEWVADPTALRARVDLLAPAYRIKWVCILMNEFLAVGRRRRVFAVPGEDLDVRQARQLAAARAMLHGAEAAPHLS
ncbi:MAG: phosphotransferase [Nitrospirae bacterium]|nr:phosphotransferase [Nitrospirota bacterium]